MTDEELFPDEPLDSPSDDGQAPTEELAEFEIVDLESDGEAGAAPGEPDEAIEAGPKTVYRGSGVRWGFVVGLVLAVLLVILVFQNTEPVSFQFLVWEIETPLAALLIATAVIAAVADELVGLVVRARRRRRLAEKEELKKLREHTKA